MPQMLFLDWGKVDQKAKKRRCNTSISLITIVAVIKSCVVRDLEFSLLLHAYMLYFKILVLASSSIKQYATLYLAVRHPEMMPAKVYQRIVTSYIKQ